jgi:hypothetical protein
VAVRYSGKNLDSLAKSRVSASIAALQLVDLNKSADRDLML